eukprot:ctg_502.g255
MGRAQAAGGSGSCRAVGGGRGAISEVVCCRRYLRAADPLADHPAGRAAHQDAAGAGCVPHDARRPAEDRQRGRAVHVVAGPGRHRHRLLYARCAQIRLLRAAASADRLRGRHSRGRTGARRVLRAGRHRLGGGGLDGAVPAGGGAHPHLAAADHQAVSVHGGAVLVVRAVTELDAGGGTGHGASAQCQVAGAGGDRAVVGGRSDQRDVCGRGQPAGRYHPQPHQQARRAYGWLGGGRSGGAGAGGMGRPGCRGTAAGSGTAQLGGCRGRDRTVIADGGGSNGGVFRERPRIERPAESGQRLAAQCRLDPVASGSSVPTDDRAHSEHRPRAGRARPVPRLAAAMCPGGADRDGPISAVRQHQGAVRRAADHGHGAMTVSATTAAAAAAPE